MERAAQRLALIVAAARVTHQDTLLRLRRDDVHVWILRLDLSRAQLARLASVISAEEFTRAERFAVPANRRRYVAAHGLLRLVLASYVCLGPKRLSFEKGAGGKPRLADRHQLRFNLSHSNDLALVAVSANREVGVDIEKVCEMPDLESLARICFSPVEQAALAAVPAGQRQLAFFAGWTRKEAFLKAQGDGLSRPLHSFDVTLTPAVPARVLRVQPPDAAHRYALRTLEPAPGYVGALATEGGPVTVHWRGWQRLEALLEGAQEDRAST